MDKISFLTAVAEVMKGMISHETVMAAIQRTGMRGIEETRRLMEREEERVDRVIGEIRAIEQLDLPEEIMDVLVLRYLKNTQFLAKVKEEAIDVSGLDGELGFWKKTMLFRCPAVSAEDNGQAIRFPVTLPYLKEEE
jgi:hypothetical protein